MKDLKSRTCCFTGHRRIPPEDAELIVQRAEECIRGLYERGVRFFRVGGAIGFDTMMAQLLFRLRDSGLSDIKVSLFFPFDGFTDGWTDEQKTLYAVLLPQYDDVLRVSDEAGREAYLARDRALVDGAAYCIAYCTRQRSGAAYTVRYALTKNVNVCRIEK